MRVALIMFFMVFGVTSVFADGPASKEYTDKKFDEIQKQIDARKAKS